MVGSVRCLGNAFVAAVDCFANEAQQSGGSPRPVKCMGHIPHRYTIWATGVVGDGVPPNPTVHESLAIFFHDALISSCVCAR
eukprot:4684215-Amphidinium_carterae.1